MLLNLTATMRKTRMTKDDRTTQTEKDSSVIGAVERSQIPMHRPTYVVTFTHKVSQHQVEASLKLPARSERAAIAKVKQKYPSAKNLVATVAKSLRIFPEENKKGSHHVRPDVPTNVRPSNSSVTVPGLAEPRLYGSHGTAG